MLIGTRLSTPSNLFPIYFLHIDVLSQMSATAIPGLSLLKSIDDFDSFSDVRSVSPESISKQLIAAVKNLDEREELEPYLRFILYDPNETPHGPAELADIFTHKLQFEN